MKQTTFDESHDNAGLMLANYYKGAVEPTESGAKQEPSGCAAITYSGTKPAIKVGGSWKTFTPVFNQESTTVDKWFVSANGIDITGDTNYIMERDGEKLKLKVSQNYNLISTVLIVKVVGTDNSAAELKVEVI
jgi:hypothetical protein